MEATRRKVGRPKLSEDSDSPSLFTMRVSPQDLEAMKQGAEKDGMKLSAWVRYLASLRLEEQRLEQPLALLDKMREVTPEVVKALREIVRQEFERRGME